MMDESMLRRLELEVHSQPYSVVLGLVDQVRALDKQRHADHDALMLAMKDRDVALLQLSEAKKELEKYKQARLDMWKHEVVPLDRDAERFMKERDAALLQVRSAKELAEHYTGSLWPHEVQEAGKQILKAINGELRPT